VAGVSGILLEVFVCAQSRDRSAPVYQSGCSEAPSFESIGLANSSKANVFFLVESGSIRLNLEECLWFCVVDLIPVSLPYFVVEFHYCSPDGRAALLCFRHQVDIYQDFFHFPLFVLDCTDGYGKGAYGFRLFFFQRPFAIKTHMRYQVPPNAMVHCDPWFLKGSTVALYVP